MTTSSATVRSAPEPPTTPPAWTTPPPTPGPDGTGDHVPSRRRRWEVVADGAPARPRRSRPALAVLLLGTALLYLVDLGASGTANSFYAAAVQAGTLSWKAFFFGSLDASNAITVDKPPMSLWPMELAGRVFGFNTWSMLVPQALMGVASVWLLYATVRRWFGTAAGFLAGAVLALTPVAVLMFRFNNPDALMVLWLVLGAYATTRAIDSGRLRWVVLVGVTFGCGFLTKGLQPFTVLPVCALAVLLFAPGGIGRRILHLLVGAVAVVVSAGWWVVAVLLWPVADRPYIGGSTNNNPLELAFGYNGLGRLTGNEHGGALTSGAAAVGGAPTGAGSNGGPTFSGSTGPGRLFNAEMGGQISWLLPAALIALVALVGVGVAARRAGTSALRLLAATTVFGGWLLVTGLVLSFAGGTIHPYYTVQLAPAVAALVGIGAVTAWRLRHRAGARALLAGATVVTGAWSAVLLGRSDEWPVLRVAVAVVAVVAAIAVLALGSTRLLRRPVALAAAAAVGLAVLAGPAAYAVATAATPHAGSTPSAGPASAAGGPGGAARGGFAGGAAGGFPGAPGAASRGTSGTAPGATTGSAPGTGTTGAAPGTATDGTTGATAGAGGPGGDTTANSALVQLLERTTTRWAAATIGANSAAPLELASGGRSVMAIGGFTGSDPAPTLAQFQAWVEAGDIRYFIAGGGLGGGRGGAGGGSGTASAITAWVEAHFPATTVGGTTVYDLGTASS